MIDFSNRQKYRLFVITNIFFSCIRNNHDHDICNFVDSKNRSCFLSRGIYSCFKNIFDIIFNIGIHINDYY